MLTAIPATASSSSASDGCSKAESGSRKAKPSGEFLRGVRHCVLREHSPRVVQPSGDSVHGRADCVVEFRALLAVTLSAQ